MKPATASRGWGIGLVALVLSLGLVGPGDAAVLVAPGETAVFAQGDGGQVACRLGTAERRCDRGNFFAEATASSRTVEAAFGPASIGSGFGTPRVARAEIHNDFGIPGPPDNLVDVQISLGYNFDGRVGGTAAYEAAATLSLRIEDITSSPPVPIGSHEVFRQDRSNDQGLTDIAFGGERYVLDGESSSFVVRLRRGRTYRLWFTVEAMVELFLLGQGRARAIATWTHLAARVDEDEVEQLAKHDAAVMEEFADIRRRLDEIKRLLLTPQGRRPGFPLKP